MSAPCVKFSTREDNIQCIFASDGLIGDFVADIPFEKIIINDGNMNSICSRTCSYIRTLNPSISPIVIFSAGSMNLSITKFYEEFGRLPTTYFQNKENVSYILDTLSKALLGPTEKLLSLILERGGRILFTSLIPLPCNFSKDVPIDIQKVLSEAFIDFNTNIKGLNSTVNGYTCYIAREVEWNNSFSDLVLQRRIKRSYYKEDMMHLKDKAKSRVVSALIRIAGQIFDFELSLPY